MPTENEKAGNKRAEYKKNVVTDEEVEARHRDLDNASKERKLGRFFAWRHYASLQRDQERGYHWGYLVIGSPDGNSVQCTCGILIPQGEEKGSRSEPEIHGRLSPIQRARGHRRLPSQRGEVVAIVFELVFEMEKNRHIGSGFCQECEAMLVGQPIGEVQAFVEHHNSTCQRSKLR